MHMRTSEHRYIARLTLVRCPLGKISVCKAMVVFGLTTSFLHNGLMYQHLSNNKVRHAGANVGNLVREVITNSANFERSMTLDSAKDLTKLDGWGSCHSRRQSLPEESSHRLVIRPRHDETVDAPHGCSICPANLCKVNMASPAYSRGARDGSAVSHSPFSGAAAGVSSV